MKALGNVAGGLTLMKSQEACGDFEKSQMIESFSDLAFAYDPLDSGVSKGDPHDGPRLDGVPDSRGKRGMLQAMGLGCPKDTGFLPICEAHFPPDQGSSIVQIIR
jgi:hypothetical protein